MEIKLTKTKTITIGGGGRKKRRSVDIVGVDLFSGDPRGCPAVRLIEKKGVLHLTAADFIPPPEAGLPSSWEEAAKSCTWSLPGPFQAPGASMAVSSPDMFLVQTTNDAFKADIAAGAHRAAADESAGNQAPKTRRFGIKHDKPAEAAAQPEPKRQENVESVKIPEAVPGKPISNGGTRFIMKPMSAEGFVMEAGMPEYQLLWLSRLLPEGKRPTAVSVQLRSSAITAAVCRQPVFQEEKGSTLAVFISDETVNIVGYRDHDVVLLRNCRNAPGWKKIRTAVKKGLGLDDEMVESVLDDTLIDPRPVLDPVLSPIADELAVSRDYLVSKLGVEPKAAMVFGLPAGIGYFSALAEERSHIRLVRPDAFEGITIDEKAHLGEQFTAKGSASHVFLGALGAALAYLEDQEAT